MAKLKGKPQYIKQFKLWDECLKKAGVPKVADLFKRIHAEIRKNPVHAKKAVKTNPKRDHLKLQQKRLKGPERKARVAKKI